MRKNTFGLMFFIIMACVFGVILGAETIYSQGHDKGTVIKAQKRLQELGYQPGPLDGIWGRKTKRALGKFQKDQILPVTGELDLITKEKLGIISLKKSEPPKSIPVGSIEEGIRGALKPTWEIKKVRIEKDILTVVPNSPFINKKGYASIIREICKNPDVSLHLKEIWILNANQNQGWVLIQPEKCNQITKVPLDQMDPLIFSYSADVIVFESK